MYICIYFINKLILGYRFFVVVFWCFFLADGVKTQDRIVHYVGYFAWEEKPVILKSFQVEIVIGLCCVAWESRYRIIPTVEARVTSESVRTSAQLN